MFLMSKGDSMGKMMTAISDKTGLIKAVRKEDILEGHGTHEWHHLMRVLETERIFAVGNGADIMMLKLFALFHDTSQRNDGHDPQHGQRAAFFTEGLQGVFFEPKKRPWITPPLHSRPDSG